MIFDDFLEVRSLKNVQLIPPTHRVHTAEQVLLLSTLLLSYSLELKALCE